MDTADNRSNSSGRKQANKVAESHWHKREEVSGAGKARKNTFTVAGIVLVSQLLFNELNLP
jgi:hypothetical protein